MSRSFTGAADLTAAGLLVMGLAVASTPTQALTVDEIANLTGPDRAKILLEGAKKEGKTVLYSAMNTNATLRPIQTEFAKRFAGLKFEYWRGNSNEAMRKISAEAQANNRVADMVEGGSGALPAIKGGFAQGFTSPSLVPYDKDSLHPQGLYAPSRINYYGLAYNSKLVPKADVPKTYDELLDPKWKGKIAWTSGADSGAYMFISTILRARGEKDGEAYLAGLAKQNIADDPAGLTAVTVKVPQGEYHMVLNASAVTPVQMKRKKAPIDVEMLEPIPTQINTITLIKNAPHPYATMVFLDWFLSAEGQTFLGSTGYLPVHPEADASEDSQEILPKNVKKKAFYQTPEAVFEGKPRAVAVFKKYFN